MRFNKKSIYFLASGLNAINMVIPLITFFFVCIVTYKALINKNEKENYEDFFITIENKDDYTVDYEFGSNNIDNKYKDIEVNEYINYLNRKLEDVELTDDIKLTIRTLENLFNSSYNHFAFKYTDIYSGFTV